MSIVRKKKLIWLKNYPNNKFNNLIFYMYIISIDYGFFDAQFLKWKVK